MYQYTYIDMYSCISYSKSYYVCIIVCKKLKYNGVFLVACVGRFPNN